MALQAITIADEDYERAKYHDDFIRRMIFPGGCIPSVEAIARSVARATDLTIVDLEDIGRRPAQDCRRGLLRRRTELGVDDLEVVRPGRANRLAVGVELAVHSCPVGGPSIVDVTQVLVAGQ